MNLTLPRIVDNNTTLDKTACTEDNGRVYLMFAHTILNASYLPKNIQKIAKDGAKKQFCSNIEFRNALNFLSFDFFYLTKQKEPITSFTINKNDCK
jgi:hypothetical protein